MLITEEYLKQNKELHATKNYGICGHMWADTVKGMAEAMGTKDILDYGCGQGTLAKHLPYAIKQYDPAIEKYSSDPKPADIVVCTDVLEHVEEECVDAVLDHIQSLMQRTGLFVIGMVPARKTLPDGRNAHITLKPHIWWLEKLFERFKVMNFYQREQDFVVMVTV